MFLVKKKIILPEIWLVKIIHKNKDKINFDISSLLSPAFYNDKDGLGTHLEENKRATSER